jgi:hypothetical protein
MVEAANFNPGQIAISGWGFCFRLPRRNRGRDRNGYGLIGPQSAPFVAFFF